MSATKKMLEIPQVHVLQDLQLTSEQFSFFSKLMYELSGVNLPFTTKNEALVKNRLAKLLRRYKLSDYESLRIRLENPDAQTLNDFISCLTTNKTHFFREESHFDWLIQYMKTHFNHHPDFRLWCAAASTGQEPYTAAMLMREHLTPQQLAKSKFLATDIDLQCLQKAAEGVYSKPEMEGCPENFQQKYFDIVKGADAKFRIKDEVANMVKFAPLNLVQDVYPIQNKFHVIFCRNVLIYFDPQTTKRVIEKLADQLVPGGYLILGHSESGTVKSPKIKALSRAIYQKI